MIAVLDANIAIALLVPLPYSNGARQAVGRATRLIAPDLLIHETTNALWRIAMAGQMPPDACIEVLGQIPLLLDDIVPAHSIAAEALADAIRLRHPAYDMFYTALVKANDGILITADRKLASAAEQLSLRVVLVT
jgi:predicted nucleic acid-binding protein